MAAYTGNAVVFRNGLVKFAATDYTNQVNKVRLVPDTPIQQMRTLVPDGVITDVDSTVWTLELSGIQDNETGGLAAYLLANNGQLVTAIVAPIAGTGKKQFTVSVRLLPAPIGGDQGEFLQFDLTLPIQGQPVASAQP